MLRLGRHHFAYLRSIAYGLDRVDSARRYLAIDHAASAVTAHRLVIERLRALARRRGDRRWRLIGVVVPAVSGAADHDAPISDVSAEPPTIDAWAEANGLGDWSQAELQAQYAEAFPADRKADRNRRLLDRQLALLHELERTAAESPQPTHAIAGWFDEATARRFIAAGWVTLDDVRRAVARGGRWWRSMPGVGRTKADRLAAYLAALLPASATAVQRHRVADAFGPQIDAIELNGDVLQLQSTQTDASIGSNRAVATSAGTAASSDREAIDAWIAAKAGSAATARAYRKEAERLMAWALLERRKSLSSVNADDCLGYLTFLEHPPEDWVSLRYAVRGQPGWTPFKGPLSASSRRYALGVLSALFDWLVSASYLVGNPWRLVNRKIADDRFIELDSRAFTPEAWTALAAFLKAHATAGGAARADGPRERIEFLLAFLEATGLRASELVQARLGDLRRVNRGWVLQVIGKGGKARLVVVPTQAAQALEHYLQRRGVARLVDLERPNPELAGLPLVASTLDAREPVSYSALYRSTKTWFGKAIWASDLSIQNKLDASKASLHWLRHTCGTRALDRGVSIETVQRQLGHSDARTTMRYAKPQLDRVQAEMERGFG